MCNYDLSVIWESSSKSFAPKFCLKLAGWMNFWLVFKKLLVNVGETTETGGTNVGT